MGAYLKIDSTRLSYGEYWRWKPGIPFLLLAFRKMLGWPLVPQVLVPAVPVLDAVDPKAYPQALVAALAKPIEACEARGRTVEFWYTAPTIGRVVGLGAALLSNDRLSIGIAVASQNQASTFREVVLSLVTRLRGGRYLATAAGKSLFDPPREVDQQRFPWGSYERAVGAHDERVQRRLNEAMPCADVRELILDMVRLQTSTNVARGIWVPASAQDIERLS